MLVVSAQIRQISVYPWSIEPETISIVVPPLQIQLIRHRVGGVMTRESLLVMIAQLNGERLRHLVGDRILDGEDVRELGVEFPRPQRSAITHADQLHC